MSRPRSPITNALRRPGPAKADRSPKMAMRTSSSTRVNAVLNRLGLLLVLSCRLSSGRLKCKGIVDKGVFYPN